MWKNVVGIKSAANDSLYLNGVLAAYNYRYGATQQLGYDIGRRRDGIYMPAKIAQVSMHNYALTPAEILQNFNVLKSRYGL